MENNTADIDDQEHSTTINTSCNSSVDLNKKSEIDGKKLLGEQNSEDYNAEEEKEEEEDEEEEEEEEDLTEALLVQMGYWKPEPKQPLPPLSKPIADIKLKSAMKGSREKEGIQSEDKRVSWAPDVYDPEPKSPEHFYTSKTIVKMKIETKKSARNKQKFSGKGAGVGGGGKVGKEKGKKQVKKHGGSASKSFNSLDEDEYY